MGTRPNDFPDNRVAVSSLLGWLQERSDSVCRLFRSTRKGKLLTVAKRQNNPIRPAGICFSDFHPQHI